MYSYDASPADAIDVDRDDFLDPVTGRRPWVAPDIVSRRLADRIMGDTGRIAKTIKEARKLADRIIGDTGGFAKTIEEAQDSYDRVIASFEEAHEAWYARRGGAAAGRPRENDRPVPTMDGLDDDDDAVWADPALTARWWRLRARREWAEANDREAVERRDAPETTAMVDSDEEDKKSDNSSDSDSDDKDDPEPFEPDPDAVKAASWPDRRDCPKGPLPGGVDPEGILATVPLLDDILCLLYTSDAADE